MRKLHVLFLNAHHELGADVAVHLGLARALDRGRVRVSAANTIAPADGPSVKQEFEAVPDTTNLSLDLGRAMGDRHGIRRAAALLGNLRGGPNLARLALWCRRHQVDVIHVTERPRQATFGLLVARMAGCACVIHAHTGFYPHDATRLATWRLRQADAVVGVSQFTAATYAGLAGLPDSRVFAVHNAVDGKVFEPSAARAHRDGMRQRLGLPRDALVIGCVARLMRWKGQGTLIEAFAEVHRDLPRARLVLAGLSSDAAPDGRGTYAEFLARRAAELGVADAVVFTGFVPMHEMPHLYGALDVLAHPSLEEPFGLAVVEAMACGQPVVASGAGGIPEIIRDGAEGVLVAPGERTALARALVDVLQQPALMDRLGGAGRARVLDAFSPERQADAMLRVYQQVVSRRESSTLPSSHLAPLGQGFAR